MDKDVTSECRFGENDEELLPLKKCVCGKKFDSWDFILSIYREDPHVCDCGRKLYFRNKITIYEIT